MNIRNFTLNGLNMNYTLNDVRNCTAFLQTKGVKIPVAAIVLGTGLGAFVKNVDIKISVPYSEIGRASCRERV